MTCYSPLQAFKGKASSSGKLSVVWRERDSEGGERLALPCGKCIGCNLDRSRSWAVRCWHEASLHERNAFVTLTFNEANLPGNRSLDVSVFQKFMKRLRKSLSHPVRFFHCGEYGGKLGRPHYHALLFGHDFDDRVLLMERNGNRVYRSAQLEALWPFGYSSVGDVSFASAAYVARYVIKKVRGDSADEHYVDKSTGEVLVQEYVTMSKGIGRGWFEKFASDVYPWDEVIVSGTRVRAPRFYDNLLAERDPDLLEEVKAKRRARSKYVSGARLLVMEEVKTAKVKSLKRTLEDL